jgi:heptosyltransferase-2
LAVRLARDHDAKIMLFGSAEDKSLNGQIVETVSKQVGGERITDFSGQFSLLETAAAMEFCDTVVSNDSGLMHIAAAMHKNLVAIFGSTVKEFGFFPSGDQSLVVERNGLSCRPCSHIGRPNCPEGHFRCMNDIEVGEIVSKVQLLLGRATA